MLGFSCSCIFVGVPLVIGATGRWDFYFTLTSVALLAIASAGVWLTFYIGRINIGQGAFRADWRLCFRHSGGQSGLVVLDITACGGIVRGNRGNPHRPANPASARRIFRDDYPGSNTSCHADSL